MANIYTGVSVFGLADIGGTLFPIGNSTQNSTAPTGLILIGGEYNSSPATITSTNISPLQLDSTGNLLVNVKSGTITASDAAIGATGSAVPADADYSGINVAGNMRGWTGVNPSGVVYAGQIDIASVNGNTAVTAASGVLKVGVVGNAGAALDAVQGATAPANNLSVSGTYLSTLPTLTTGQASAIMLDAKGQQLIDLNYYNGVSLTGTVTAYGTAPTGNVFGVNAYVTNTVTVTLASTTVTGTVAVTQSTSPWIVAGGGTAGTPGTAVLTVQGIAGGTTIPVTATIAAAQTLATVTTVTAVTSITNAVKIVGNTGATLDAAASQNVAAPTNMLLTGGEFNTLPATITSGNVSPLQLDSAGNLLVNIKTGGSSGAVAQGSTTSGETGMLVQGAVTTGSPGYTTAQTSPLSLTLAGGLRVDGSAVTQPVSIAGTVAVTQSTSPWIVAGGGTAGSSGTAVLTVQGITGGTTIPVTAAQGTAANLNATVVGTGTFVVQATLQSAAATVVGTVRVLGNVGGVMDAVLAAAAPANALQVGGKDSAGNLQALSLSTNRTLITIPADEALASLISNFSFDTGLTMAALTATEIPIFSVQTNSTTKVFTIRGIEFSGNGSLYRWRLIRNPGTLTTSSFSSTTGTYFQGGTWALPTGSSTKIDTAATTIAVGTGIVVDSGYVSAAQILKPLTIYMLPGATGDIYTLAAAAAGGTNASCLMSMQWTESAAAL